MRIDADGNRVWFRADNFEGEIGGGGRQPKCAHKCVKCVVSVCVLKMISRALTGVLELLGRCSGSGGSARQFKPVKRHALMHTDVL